MANTTPVGVYYRTNAEAAATLEAQSLSLANSVNNAVGLVSVVPTSVTKVGAGTPTVSSSGLISFSNISDIQPNGVFSSSYTNYRVIVQFTNTNTTEIRQRYSVDGTVRTDALLWWGGVFNNSSGAVAYYAGQNIDWGAGGAIQPAGSQTLTMDVINPAVSGPITRQNTHFGGWNGAAVNATFSMMYNSTAAVDGLRIYILAGTMTGTMQVFGYR
jgi:hypothetical protein